MAKPADNLVKKEQNRQDLGFGTKVTDKQTRMVRPNGEFNVIRIGQPFSARINSYHRLITMHWALFTCIIFGFYFFVNLLFALAYYGIGVDNLNGVQNDAQAMTAFWNAFFFSSQTLTTVGYGHISPSGGLASSIAAIEALFGLMMFAIITGLLYGRFSRPSPNISFSDSAIIAPYFDINGLMFRMINVKSNQLINVSANMILSRNELTDTGLIRKYYTLELERSLLQFFPMSWTVVHPITEESPLYNETAASIAEADVEILIAIEGTNDTYADPIHVRKSYLYSEIEWGKVFLGMMASNRQSYEVDLAKIGAIKDAPLN